MRRPRPLSSLAWLAVIAAVAPCFALAAPAPVPPPALPSAPAAVPAPPAGASLAQQIAAVLSHAPVGARFGLLVTDRDGHELVALRPDERFIPGSNAKLLVTTAAFALIPDITAADDSGGAAVALVPDANPAAPPDVVITGHGDAQLNTARDCSDDCLISFARSIAGRVHVVGDVIGDDRWYPDQRWPSGMSWDNLVTGSGTAASALSLDDNVFELVVRHGAPGEPPVVAAPPPVRLVNDAVTAPAPAGTPDADLVLQRLPGGEGLRLFGRLAPGTEWHAHVAVPDPAAWTARLLADQLIALGVKVTGTIRVRHRPETLLDDPRQRGTAPVAPLDPPEPPPLMTMLPATLTGDVLTINKTSQNLHAELLLRRLGRLSGGGSVADGLARVGEAMDRAGLARGSWTLADGSGMSSYDRVTPRALVTLLRWVAAQPWAPAWRASLPVAGVDGTLAHRFTTSPLKGQLTAKTGTLNGTSAISGYLRAASGRELVFSLIANDVPEGTPIHPVLDSVLEAVAAAN